ncbi:MAG: carboxypeptidase-like regulatory domain-containing protein [Blastocatellia bacterium]
MRNIIRQMAASVLLLMLFALQSLAQTAATGTVLGTVKDASGAVIAGAEVKLVNPAINDERAQKTNESGQYIFIGVPPGVYTITAGKQGFNTNKENEIRVEVAKSQTIDFILAVGTITQVVEVDSQPGAELQTTDATVGTVLPGEVMLRLGNLTRSAGEFLTLQAGVTPATNVLQGGTVAGSRSDQSTFSIDGIDVTQNLTGSLAPVVPIFIDYVEEFRVGVANSNATFGRSAGAQVALSSRRGSNLFHGAGYWTHQNDNLNAATWTNKRTVAQNVTDPEIRAKLQEPELKDNRFGGKLGGPIWRDKTFFFGDYEGRRFPQTASPTRVVPTDTLRQGILRFRDATGNIVSYDLKTAAVCGTTQNQACDPRGIGLSPTVQALWSQLPAPNDPSGGDGLNTQLFRGNVSLPVRNDFGHLRLDHSITSKWRFNGSYNYFRGIRLDALQLDIRGGEAKSLLTRPDRNDSVITGLVGEITPTLINTFRFGFVRNRLGFGAQTPSTSATQLAIPGTNSSAGFIALDAGGTNEPIDVGAQQARSQLFNSRSFQFVEDLAWVKGSHTFQFGTNFRRLPILAIKDDKLTSTASLAAFAGSGVFTSIPSTLRPPTCGGAVTTNCLATSDQAQWNSLYASALGLVDNVNVVLARDGSLNPLPLGTPIVADTVHNAYEFYAQDIWRPTSSLILNLGLNYQWATTPKEKLGRQTILIDNTTKEPIDVKLYLETKRLAAEKGQVFNPQLAYLPVNSSGRDGVFDVDRNNFGPRLSAAWNPGFGSGLLGKLFGERRTVIRGGFGIVYDRVNNVTSVVFPQLGIGFTQTLAVNAPLCNQTGGGGAACNAASTNLALSRFRVGVDGLLPLPTVPAASNPVVPPANLGEQFSFQVDPNFNVGMNYSGDLTIQRELPGNMILEVGWVGRWARDLQQSRDLNAMPIFFKDVASGQTFAQAFDAVATQLRNGVAPTSVNTQSWFENQVRPGATRLLASALQTQFINGQVSLISALGIDPLRQQAINNRQTQSQVIFSDGGVSNYHGLLISLRKRLSRGLYFDVNYTLSKSLDQVGLTQDFPANFANPYDTNANYGPSFFDRRHVFNASALYDLPFGRGRRFSAGKWADKIIGGWYVSSIFTASSGLPLFVAQGGEAFGGGLASIGATAIPLVDPGQFGNSPNSPVVGSNGIGTNGDPARGGSGINLFANPEAAFNSFRQVLISQDTRTGRGNALRGFPYWNLDMSFGKKTAVTEQVNLVFHADFFNLPNHVNFNDPATSLASRPSFGVVSSQLVVPNRTSGAGSRWIQLGMRIEF